MVRLQILNGNCVNITDFEMGLANMRLVPLVPIEL